MEPDVVMKEVYRAKDQFAPEIENDVGKLFERLREDAKKHPERRMQPAPKPVTPKKPRTTGRKTAK